ncbi:MAG TPA: 30S ribosomal protein S13 [Planctomycetota bacterium]|nr:30S ribosomal protein S13 [Planctomycetota bacterium]
MPRLVGVDIPNDKALRISLRYIFGVGPKLAMDICSELGLDPNVDAGKVSDEDIARVANLLDRKYLVEGQLRRQIAQNIGRLKAIRCYRGMRHIRGLPVRGQHTQSNARTRKGPRKTVAGKKSVKAMK